jgi:hypothetical protein
MIIDDFNVFSAGFRPAEADAPLPIDSDAVLSGSISLERFQPIAGRHVQIVEICGNFKLSQFPARDCGHPRKSLDAVSFRKSLSVGARKGSNH